MQRIEPTQTATGWCFGCNGETPHELRVVPADRHGDGLPRRERVCVECGIAGSTVVEISEVEYHRLRRAERQLAEAQQTLRRVIEAVLAGEELPAPFRRTERAAAH